MESVFLKILNMSITASWLMLAVILLRLVLRHAPSAIRVVMWALVGLRLMCPVYCGFCRGRTGADAAGVLQHLPTSAGRRAGYFCRMRGWRGAADFLSGECRR